MSWYCITFKYTLFLIFFVTIVAANTALNSRTKLLKSANPAPVGLKLNDCVFAIPIVLFVGDVTPQSCVGDNASQTHILILI